MGCTPAGNKTFLVICNVVLMMFGFSILSLGVKMQMILTTFFLDNIPILINSVRAVTATGFLVTATGASGVCGACYEMLWLVLVHLGGLTFIVVMEFSLGITLMVLKNTVEAALEESSCGNLCKETVSFMISKFVTPSAGIMMTIIVMEGLMIYSAIQLYFYLKNYPKASPVPAAGPTVVVQNVQMQNVGAPPQPMYAMPAPPQAPCVNQPQFPAPPPQAPCVNQPQFPAPPPQAPCVNQPQFPAPPPYTQAEQPYAQPPPQQPYAQSVPQQPYSQPVPQHPYSQQPYAQPVPQQQPPYVQPAPLPSYAQPPSQPPVAEAPLDTITLKQPKNSCGEVM